MANNNGAEMVTYTKAPQTETLGSDGVVAAKISTSALEPTSMIDKLSQKVAR